MGDGAHEIDEPTSVSGRVRRKGSRHCLFYSLNAFVPELGDGGVEVRSSEAGRYKGLDEVQPFLDLGLPSWGSHSDQDCPCGGVGPGIVA